jgi:hypothetical protein
VPSFVEKYPKIKYRIFDRPHFWEWTCVKDLLNHSIDRIETIKILTDVKI